MPSNQRSFAMGLQFLVVRVFGMLPGPIVVGNIYDNNCATWKYDLCGRKAFCAEYELDGISSGNRNVILVCSSKSFHNKPHLTSIIFYPLEHFED